MLLISPKDRLSDSMGLILDTIGRGMTPCVWANTDVAVEQIKFVTCVTPIQGASTNISSLVTHSGGAKGGGGGRGAGGQGGGAIAPPL